jgi:hypothetical protein
MKDNEMVMSIWGGRTNMGFDGWSTIPYGSNKEVTISYAKKAVDAIVPKSNK